MSFIADVKSSIYSPEYYRDIPKKTFGSAIKYFLLLSLLLSLIKTVFISPPVISGANVFIKKTTEKALSLFPPDLRISIQKGQVSANVPQPFFIPLSKEPEDQLSAKNLLVLDTGTPFSATKFTEYAALIWVTKDAVFYKNDENNEIKSYDLSQVKDFTIDQPLVSGFVQKILPYTKFIVPVIVLIIFAGLYTAYTLRLIYLLLFSLVLLLFSKLFSWNLTYAGAYKTGMYAMTGSLLFEFLVEQTQQWTHFGGFMFMFSLVTLFIVILNSSGLTVKSKK